MRWKRNAATVALMIGASNVQASLLVYDGFDYTSSGSVNLNGQTAPITAGNNFGFVSGSAYTAGSTDVQPGSLFYSGTFSPGSGFYTSVGGKVRTNAGGGAGNFGIGATGSGASAAGGRPFDTGTASVADTVSTGTYYYSFLWSNQFASSQARGYFNVFASVPGAFASGSNAYQDGIGVRFDGGAFGVNSLAGGAVVSGTNVSGVNYATAAAGTVYLIVGKTVINGNSSTNQFWVNPTDFTIAGAISGGNASGIATLAVASTPVKKTFGDRPNGSTGNVDFYIDEVRVGTSLGDVVSIVPEPTTLAAVAISFGAMLRRRSRV